MMTKETLIKRHQEHRDRYKAKHEAFYANPSISRLEPFKIADQLYYVGDKEVCIHLIDTGDGLILLDSGFFGATHLLVDSIWRLGFDPANVRWIIHSHGHSDHFGASEEFRNMYGTKLAISRIDAEMIRNKSTKKVNERDFPFAQFPEFDYEIEDGEIFEFGNMKIRCVLTPGHTDGVLSFFFDVTDNGKTYLAGMFGGAGLSAIMAPAIVALNRRRDCAHQMLSSVEKLLEEPVVVHLGNHPQNNATLEKRNRQLKEGGNPFIAPDSWRKFLTAQKTKVERIIADNEEIKKQLGDL